MREAQAVTRKRKSDGRRPRGYRPAGPPAVGVSVERVDEHTATLRSHEYLTDETLAFVRDIAENYQRATIEEVRKGE